MRLAPPVRVRCAGGRAWRAVRCGLPTLALTATVAWVLGLQERALWPAPVAGLVFGALLWLRLPPRVCTLEWDGTRWAVDGQAGTVDVMMDFGAWLLLRQRPPTAGPAGARLRAHWLAVTAAEAGPALHGLRAALYAPAPPAR